MSAPRPIKKGHWRPLTEADFAIFSPKEKALLREQAVSVWGTPQELQDVLEHDTQQTKGNSYAQHR